MKQKLLLAAVVLLSVTLLTSPAAVTAAAPAPPTPAETYAQQAFATTNAKRVQHDRARLHQHSCLQAFANAQARRMASQRRIFHQDLGPILRRCRQSTVGENVAVGYPTGRATVAAWMASPGHRANILRASFRRMAIAARKGSDGRWYVAQVFGRNR